LLDLFDLLFVLSLDYFVQFSQCLPQARIKMVFDAVIRFLSFFNEKITLLQSFEQSTTTCSQIDCEVKREVVPLQMSMSIYWARGMKISSARWHVPSAHGGWNLNEPIQMQVVQWLIDATVKAGQGERCPCGEA
jgi:hypothetical protein